MFYYTNYFILTKCQNPKCDLFPFSTEVSVVQLAQELISFVYYHVMYKPVIWYIVQYVKGEICTQYICVCYVRVLWISLT